MKKATNLSLLLLFVSFMYLACASSSDDYNPPSEEEESLILEQAQMATDSINANAEESN